jgi:hypothetical protein
MIRLISNYRYYGISGNDNDRDNDRRLAYAFWHNDRRMIRLMMCAPGATI